MSKKFNFWFCMLVGIPALVGGISRLFKYLDKVIDVIFNNGEADMSLLIGYPLILLFVLGMAYAIVRIGLEQWPLKKSS